VDVRKNKSIVDGKYYKLMKIYITIKELKQNDEKYIRVQME
jgi:hypothetical protein